VGRVKAYPCIGGPLDGQHATTKDFGTDGMFEHLDAEYAYYNFGYVSWRRDRSKPLPTMVFLHRDVLAPVISARLR
jgi:hypothetical protein